MKRNSLERPTAYLCPRIVGVENHYVHYGGNQAWYATNTAYKGGCGPVSGANVLTVYADKHPQYQEVLNLHIDDKHFVSQDEYLALMESLYKSMHILEVPLLSNLYNRLSRNNKVFNFVPVTFGTNISSYTCNLLKYALKKDIYLQYRSMSTVFCNYIRGLTFIKMAINNGYPVVLVNTNRAVYCNLFERPYMPVGSIKKIKRHFITITDIKEPADGTSPQLTITTWGKTGNISYADLYKAWQSPLAFGSGMVYFNTAKNKRTTKRAIIKSRTILFKR